MGNRRLFHAQLRASKMNDESFYLGSQGLPLAPVAEKIVAYFDRESSAEELKSLRRQTKLRASKANLEEQKNQAEAVWSLVQERFGLLRPPSAMAWVCIALCAATLSVDSFLLSFSMDALGIAEPTLQLLSAFGLASLATLIFHVAHRLSKDAGQPFGRGRIGLAVGIAAVVALTCWGMMRVDQAQFAAAIAQNPLGSFLADHLGVARVFFVALTVGTPFVGALILGHALPTLYATAAWNRAFKHFERVRAKLHRSESALAAEPASLRMRKAQLKAEKTIWTAASVEFHARGSSNGAVQLPEAMPPVGATLCASVVTGLLLASPFSSSHFAVLLVAAVLAWSLAYSLLRHIRSHPPLEIFRSCENARFTEAAQRNSGPASDAEFRRMPSTN